MKYMRVGTITQLDGADCGSNYRPHTAQEEWDWWLWCTGGHYLAMSARLVNANTAVKTVIWSLLERATLQPLAPAQIAQPSF
jgi:hypothetical protein